MTTYFSCRDSDWQCREKLLEATQKAEETAFLNQVYITALIIAVVAFVLIFLAFRYGKGGAILGEPDNRVYEDLGKRSREAEDELLKKEMMKFFREQNRE